MAEESRFVRSGLSIDRDYLIVRNSWVRDPRIAGNPLSIFLYLLSHDTSFIITTEKLRRDLNLGKDAYLSARRKLEQCGFLRSEIIRYEQGELDEAGRGIGGRVRRTDFYLMDPASPAAEPVDKAEAENPPQFLEAVDNPENPWNLGDAENPPLETRRWKPADRFSSSLKENQVKETQSSSVNEVTTEGGSSDDAPRRDDDSQLDVQLDKISKGLTVRAIRAYLVAADGPLVDPDTINYVAAALETIPVASGKVSNPAKYVATCIVKAPGRWMLPSALPSAVKRDAEWCAANGGCNWLPYGDADGQLVYCTRHDAQAQDPQSREIIAA